MKLIIDFNSATSEYIVAPLSAVEELAFAQVSPRAGSSVILEDLEGFTANGVIDSIENNALKVLIDWQTVRSTHDVLSGSQRFDGQYSNLWAITGPTSIATYGSPRIPEASVA
jgi:hypothetical protein